MNITLRIATAIGAGTVHIVERKARFRGAGNVYLIYDSDGCLECHLTREDAEARLLEISTRFRNGELRESA